MRLSGLPVLNDFVARTGAQHRLREHRVSAI